MKLTVVVKHYVLPAQAMTQLVIIVIVRFQVNSPVPLLPHNVLVVFVRQCTLFRSFLMFLIRTLNFVANLMNLNLDSYICSWFVLSLDPCLSILVFRFWGHVLHCCRLLVFVSGHVDWSSLECLVLDEQVQYTNPRWIDMWQCWVGIFALILTLLAKLGQYTNLVLNSPFLVTFFYPLITCQCSIDTLRLLCMCWNCLPPLWLYHANFTLSFKKREAH